MRSAWHWPVRVYYEDTDAGGIVFYANYLRFFERARTEWLRHLGFEHAQLRRETGILFVVKSMQVDYHRPAQLDDLLQLDIRLLERKRASLLVEQSAWLPGHDPAPATLLVSARVRLACIDGQSLRPLGLPAVLQQRLDAFEAPGQAPDLNNND